MFLEILQNSQENTCPRVSFLIKLQAWVSFLVKLPATLLKKNSGAGIFLWILWNFSEHLFYRTPLNDCFCVSPTLNKWLHDAILHISRLITGFKPWVFALEYGYDELIDWWKFFVHDETDWWGSFATFYENSPQIH